MKLFRSSLFTLCLCLYTFVSYAQTLLNESFDNPVFAPPGWYTVKIFPTTSPTVGLWDRVVSGSYPTVTPHSGAAMARFNSLDFSASTVSELGTPRLDFSSGGLYRARFWVYRSVYSAFRNDLVNVYISRRPNASEGTRLASIPISCIKEPIEAVAGWKEYMYEIPASFNTDSNYLIFSATSDRGNIIYIDDVIIETFQCAAPAAATISNLLNTSATATWVEPVNGSSAQYEWEVRREGSAGSGAAGLIAFGGSPAGMNSASLNGLPQGTTLSFYVRSVCGSERSAWSSATAFTTPYEPFTIPYTQNFDAITSGIPSCMSVENIDGGYTWMSTALVFGSAPNYSRSAPNAFICFGSSVQNDWFFLPQMNLHASKCYQLSFSNRNTFSQYRSYLKVALGTTQNAQSMTNGELLNIVIANDTFKTIKQTFVVPTDGAYTIGFNFFGNEGNPSLIIDDITINEGLGIPAGITTPTIEATTAQLTWNAPACGEATQYEWETRTSGAAGSGANGLVAVDSGSNLLANISGLAENRQYTFYVRAKNGALVSQWSTGYVFRTNCSVRALPYKERFDNYGTAFPPCVTKQDVAAPYNPWNTWIIDGYNKPYSPPYCMRFGTNNSTIAGDNWFFTPPFNFTAGVSYRLSFYYQADDGLSGERLEVRYGIGATAAAMITTPIFSNLNIINTLYKNAVVDFVAPQTGTYNIGFHGISAAIKGFVFVDDVEVSETPSCDIVKELAARTITATKATLQWNQPQAGLPEGYQWELRTNGAAGSGSAGLVASGQGVVSATSVQLINLSPATKYTFYIRSTCGVQSGNWVSTEFYTACEAVRVPYKENFDAVSAPMLPGCTKTEEKFDRYSWNNTTGIARSAPNSLYHPTDWRSQFEDWFFTAPLQLIAGRPYRLSFNYRQEVSGYVDGIQVKMGIVAQGDSMTSDPIYTNLNVNSTAYQTATAPFTVATSGVYVLGFRSIVDTRSRGFAIDDIEVNELNPDLKVNRLVLSDSVAYTSAVITASFSIANQGLLPAGAHTVKFYLSANNELTPNANGDTLLQSYSITTTLDAAATTATINQPISLPCNIPDGTYYLFCSIDEENSVLEIQEDNNTGVNAIAIRKGAYWNGSVNTAWETPGNWSCNQVPDQNTTVIINNGEAVIHSGTTIKSLSVKNGATVTVLTGVLFKILFP